MDMVFWRSRGGELAEVDEADQFIADGDYFERPGPHILGKEDGPSAARTRPARPELALQGHRRAHRLPAARPRARSAPPACSATSPRERRALPDRRPRRRRHPRGHRRRPAPALELGRRVGRYLAAVGADEADGPPSCGPSSTPRARDFARQTSATPGAPKPLRALADKRGLPAAQQILSAFDKTGS
jgi:hypothetical protein